MSTKCVAENKRAVGAEGARAVFELIRAVERNTKAVFEGNKGNSKGERKTVIAVLTQIYGRPPTQAEIEMAEQEVWRS